MNFIQKPNPGVNRFVYTYSQYININDLIIQFYYIHYVHYYYYTLINLFDRLVIMR